MAMNNPLGWLKLEERKEIFKDRGNANHPPKALRQSSLTHWPHARARISSLISMVGHRILYHNYFKLVGLVGIVWVNYSFSWWLAFPLFFNKFFLFPLAIVWVWVLFGYGYGYPYLAVLFLIRGNPRGDFLSLKRLCAGGWLAKIQSQGWLGSYAFHGLKHLNLGSWK